MIDQNIKLYVGALIEHESERAVLAQIIQTISSANQPALIIANVNLSGRQIDVILATEERVLLIEAKGYTRPLKGGKNGPWEFLAATGKWKTIGRNYYLQALEAKNALQASMSSYAKKPTHYPDAALIFVPKIPQGSLIPPGDFKVKIGDLNLLKDLNRDRSKTSWSLSEWGDFAQHQNLIHIKSLESAFHKQLANAQVLLERYRKAFLETYKPQVENMVPFPCQAGENFILSTEILNQKVTCEGILIVGPSGCGKSMFAKSFGLQCLKAGVIPVILEAKYFEKEFGMLLNQEITLLDIPSAKDLFYVCKLLSKPLLIILDGFNECRDLLRHRLSRCLRAIAIRYQATIIVTSQDDFEELKLFKWKTVCVPEPSIEVKKSIANLPDDIKSIELLELAKSGLEADMIRQVNKDIAPGSSRYALFDAYIRRRLGNEAQEGIRILSCIGGYLSEHITFSISIRDYDRLIEANNLSTTLSKQLLTKDVLKKYGTKLSFGHELYFSAFLAEAVVRASGNDVEKIMRSLSEPKHSSHKSLIIGAIDNTDMLDKILTRIKDPSIILSCATGECGSFAFEWARDQCHEVIQLIKEEADSVKFQFDEKSRIFISADPDSLYSLSEQGQAFIHILPSLLKQAQYLEEVFEVVSVIDYRVRVVFDGLINEERNKNIALRSSLFAVSLSDQNSPVAISKVISKLELYPLFYSKDNEAKIKQWVEEKLAIRSISNGQVYMLLKLLRNTRDKKNLAKALPKLLHEKWGKAPYHLKIALLDAAWGCSNCEEEDKALIVDVLNGIETNNIMLSTSVIDALKNLGAIDGAEYEETVTDEIEQVFKNPEKPESWTLARSLYNRQFDHPYDETYWEILHSLPSDKRKEFLSLAVRVKVDFNLFNTCLITDLATFGDKNTGKYIEHWAELPSKDSPMHQEAVGVFVVSNIVLGRLLYPLSSKVYKNVDIDNAMLACGEVYYWINRNDLSLEERKRQCQKAWVVLLQHELGVTLSAIYECENALKGLGSLWGENPGKASIIKAFPKEVAEAFRQALLNREIQSTSGFWVRQKEIIIYAISVLGHYGKLTDITILRGLVNDHHYGAEAVNAIRQLEDGLM